VIGRMARPNYRSTTLEGAPSKLRLDGGFHRGLHRRKTSEALPDPRRSLRFDLDGELLHPSRGVGSYTKANPCETLITSH